MGAPTNRPQIRQPLAPNTNIGLGGGSMPFQGNQPVPQQATGNPMPMGNPSMTRTGSSFPNPMQNPLGMLAAAKLEHSSMIIKGLLKHLDKSNVDVNAQQR